MNFKRNEKLTLGMIGPKKSSNEHPHTRYSTLKYLKGLLTFLLSSFLLINHGKAQTVQYDCSDFNYYENDTSVFFLSKQDSAKILDYVIKNKVYNSTLSSGFKYNHDTLNLVNNIKEYFYYYTKHRSKKRIDYWLNLIEQEIRVDTSGHRVYTILNYLNHDICVIAKIVDFESVLYRYTPENAPHLRYPGLYHLQVKDILYADAQNLNVADTVLLSWQYNVAKGYDSYDSVHQKQLVSFSTLSHMIQYEVGGTYLFFLDLPYPPLQVNSKENDFCFSCKDIQPFCMNIFHTSTSTNYPVSNPRTSAIIKLIKNAL